MRMQKCCNDLYIVHNYHFLYTSERSLEKSEHEFFSNVRKLN